MSVFTSESSHGGLTSKLTASLTAIYHAYRTRQANRAGVMALSELDDYLLKDLGISRCEIHPDVYGLPGSRRWDDDARR